MKKITKVFVICAVALAFGLVMGCTQPSSGSGSKNPSGGGGLNANEQKLVGTWKVTYPTSDVPYFEDTNVGDWYPKEIVLSSDRGVVAQIRANTGGLSWTDLSNERGTWSASASALTINPVNTDASTITMNYTLSGDGKTVKTTPAPGWPEFTYTKQ